jgi:predicted extracellular nuclease
LSLSPTTSMPLQRSFAIIVAAALLLSALVPMMAPPPADAASETIVISEFRVRGPIGGNDEFIELHNLSSATADIGGWEVRGSNDSGTTGTRATIALGTTVGPGCFILLTNSASSGYTGSVAGDQTYGTGITDTGGIAVTTAAGDIVDQVGLSAGSAFKEETPLASLGGTNADRSYERLPGGTAGHEDTDDNSADFAVLSPSNPQNSDSDCIEYGGPTDPFGAGAADPTSAMVGEQTLLTVTVTPGGNPESTGLAVTADLEPIGGGVETFVDDGTNGDVAAGDLVFSHLATVGPVDSGSKTITATITDDQERSATTSISLTVAGAPTEIWEIQGAAHLSPMNGAQVFGVDGIVTAVSVQGFWMTDPVPDGVDATSDGIFVFRGSGGSKPAVGSHVTVDGTVSEFRPGGANGTGLTITQIGSAAWSPVDDETHPLPVTIVGSDGRTPPTEVIDNDTDGSVEDPTSGTVFDPAEDGIDFWESLEGMYLQVNDALAVGPRNNFGELTIVADGGANAGPYTENGGLYVSPGDFNPERLILDDVISPTPFVNTGDTFTTAVTGVLDYSFGNFKLYPTTALVGVSAGLEREVTADQGAHEIAVASFNVENLSVTNAQAKFDALAGLVVHNLRSPDLLAIQEVQDDSGSSNNGTVTAAATWQRFIDAIANAGGPLYEYRSIDPVNNADGGAPGANIRVGFLFRTDRGLEFVDRPGGTSVNDTAAIDHPSGPQLTFSPGRIGTDDAAFNETRKSLAGEFRWRGEKLFVVANHFSSKGGDDPLFGRWQPPVRYTEFYFAGGGAADTDGWRWGQAQVVNDFVDDLLALDPDANVIVLGDMNDFQFSDTVRILTGTARDVMERTVESTGEPAVLTTLFDLLPADEQYSYIFDGNSQVLDQILVSGSILERDPVYDVVHVNADFADQVSDHDPSVMRVAFQPRRGGR